MQHKQFRSAMVVDDDVVYLRTVGLMLKKIGFADVQQFTGADEALEWLDAEPTELIVSDWDMPTINGLEFLKAVRSSPKTMATAFILNTGNLSETYWTQGIQAGASFFLFKPFGFPDFRDAVFSVRKRPII
jgi:two-component system chemotaxis response regulator CheY